MLVRTFVGPFAKKVNDDLKSSHFAFWVELIKDKYCMVLTDMIVLLKSRIVMYRKH